MDARKLSKKRFSTYRDMDYHVMADERRFSDDTGKR